MILNVDGISVYTMTYVTKSNDQIGQIYLGQEELNVLRIGHVAMMEAAHLCSTKKTLLKGRIIGFSEVPQHGKILTRHWKKVGSNGLKINIRKIVLTG